MSRDNSGLTVTAKILLKKYAEGVDPSEGAPFEVVEQEVVLVGEDARRALEQLGGHPDATN